ncbi:hypothetical protein KUTeg_000184 [Tegillarca granosa]|uniref:Ig-like domain-containing protein n=1 Tax=Tegillarca granosa TaxID=220873 RepID=A0ABQ9FWT3_TEGGR|nr:hypothetical protein KUTeg_000184 [Tegillarca granosa]
MVILYIFIVSCIVNIKASILEIYPSSIFAQRNQGFRLTCKASNEPTAIFWTRNGTNIAAMSRNISKSTVITVQITKIFNLIIPKDRINEEDGSKWQCKDSSGAGVSGVFIFRVAIFTMTISSSSTYAKKNQDIILTCTTADTITIIIWKRDNTDIAYMYIHSNTCKSTDAGHELYSNYRYNCTNNKMYNIIIPRDRIHLEDGTKWQCLDAGGGSGSGSVVIKVESPPESDPVVTGYNGSVLYNGNVVNLTCIVKGGTPLADISWDCKGTSVTGTDKSTATTAVSELSLNVDRSFNGQICVCKSEHPLWTANRTVEIAPVSTPMISGYTNNQTLYETTKNHLTCHVTGGNPVASITWTCRGFAVSDINHSVEGEARSTITLDIDREYNNKQCICEAVHPADNYKRQTNIDIFPVASKMTFETTQDIQLTCSVEGNHRGVVFHPWTHKIGTSMIQTFNGFNTDNETVVKIPYSSYQDVGNYTCYVYDRNGFFIKSKDVELTVNDKPVITEIIKIQEQNRTVQIIVDFYSVPKPLKVEWMKEGAVVSLSEKYRQSNTVVQVTLTLHEVKVKLKGYRAKFTITNVTDTDFGSYVLRIENVKGIATQQVNYQRNNQQKDVSTPAEKEEIKTLDSTVIGIFRRRFTQTNDNDHNCHGKAREDKAEYEEIQEREISTSELKSDYEITEINS